MEVFNKTRGVVLSRNAAYAKTFLQRLRGLMFHKRKKDMVIETPGQSVAGAGIHTSFMFYPIDVAWVDDGLLVVDVARRLPPSLLPLPLRVYRPGKPAKYVVELGAGELGTTKVGDEIRFR